MKTTPRLMSACACFLCVVGFTAAAWAQELSRNQKITLQAQVSNLKEYVQKIPATMNPENETVPLSHSGH